MITAVDTNILLDLFIENSEYMAESRAMLRRCASEGALVSSGVVWAEASAHFPSAEEARDALDSIGVAFRASDLRSTLVAGRRWAEYRRGGGPRTYIISDFLIGAHALIHAERLLSRDRGFYRTYFQDLDVLDPTQE